MKFCLFLKLINKNECPKIYSFSRIESFYEVYRLEVLYKKKRPKLHRKKMYGQNENYGFDVHFYVTFLWFTFVGAFFVLCFYSVAFTWRLSYFQAIFRTFLECLYTGKYATRIDILCTNRLTQGAGFYFYRDDDYIDMVHSVIITIRLTLISLIPSNSI